MSDYEKILGIVSGVIGVPADAIAKDPASCEAHIDSLDLTEIILEVEEQFDLIVEDEEEIRTIGDILRRVEAQIA